MKEDLAKLRHARSHKDYPAIDLEDNEYVELCIKRSEIVPVLIWAGVILSAFVLFAAITIFGAGSGSFAIGASSKTFMSLIALIVFGAIIVVALISNHVYKGNILYITNKRLIQVSVSSLFSNSTNVIDLISVEDVSFRQSGVFEKLFKLGTLRMSTVGTETTYTFKYIDTPQDELETITHLVHVEKDQNSDDQFQNAVRREVERQMENMPEIRPEEIKEDAGKNITPPEINTEF